MNKTWLHFKLEAYGWGFIILLLLGIWTPEYRGRLISTSIISFIAMLIQYMLIDHREKKK